MNLYYSESTQQKYIKKVIFGCAFAAISITTTNIFVRLTEENTQQVAETQQATQDESNNGDNQPEGGSNSDPPAATASTILYPVVRVVDGDTILIKYNGEDTKLRIIGINTPETVDSRKPIECFGPEASSYLSALLTGKSVSIETDYTQDDTDKYGRLLRYVYLDNEDVGYKIISGGYGYEYTYNIPYQKQSQYKNAQAEAMENGVGLWTSCANT